MVIGVRTSPFGPVVTLVTGPVVPAGILPGSRKGPMTDARTHAVCVWN